MEPQPAALRPQRHRTALVGTALVVVAGLMTGGLLRAGDLFAAPAAPAPVALAQTTQDGSVISYMMDADGHVPDYVIGTDVTAPRAEAQVYQAAWAPDPAPASAEDWSTAPSMSGDILNIGDSAPRAAAAAVSVDNHAIDASEVAASGMTSRTEAKPAEAPAQTQAAIDHRDGQAALASAGFPTSNP